MKKTKYRCDLAFSAHIFEKLIIKLQGKDVFAHAETKSFAVKVILFPSNQVSKTLSIFPYYG